jgi:hypothetical protein
MPRAAASSPRALGDLEERVSRRSCDRGMMANKDAGGFLANFAGLTRHIIAVEIPAATMRCRRTGWRTPRGRSACAWILRQA